MPWSSRLLPPLAGSQNQLKPCPEVLGPQQSPGPEMGLLQGDAVGTIQTNLSGLELWPYARFYTQKKHTAAASERLTPLEVPISWLFQIWLIRDAGCKSIVTVLGFLRVQSQPHILKSPCQSPLLCASCCPLPLGDRNATVLAPLKRSTWHVTTQSKDDGGAYVR